MSDRQPPVGIDLGTTFSVIAYLDATGRPQTIPNSEGDLTTPSVVLFENGEATVGKEAVKAATLEPDRVAQHAKRDFGKPVFTRKIDGREYPPEVIQSRVLAKMKRDAEQIIGPIRDVVITVPAFFTEPRRKATEDAGRLAGLNVVDIINEPTAAAIAFGVQKGFLDQAGTAKQFERVLIYDLGGGTFDATIMTIEGNKYTVVATDGDVKLGGIDWDRRIADLIAEEYVSKHRIDPRLDPAGLQRLLRDAEDAKRALTQRPSVSIPFEFRGLGCKVVLTRDKFADITAGLLDRTRFTVVSLLGEAGLTWKDITRLLLVGGSSRMPMVTEMLEAESGMKVDRSLSADESVAHGAAVYAGLLAASPGESAHDVKVTNVNSHSLGVLAVDRETRRPRNAVLIPKNQPLPSTATRRFGLESPTQTNVVVSVIEGGDDSGNNAAHIGKCVIQDLPAGLSRDTRVTVAFTYETNGRLTVKASIPGVQQEATLEIERASGMSEAEIRNWSEDLSTRRSIRPISDDFRRALKDKRASPTMRAADTAAQVFAPLGYPTSEAVKPASAPLQQEPPRALQSAAAPLDPEVATLVQSMRSASMACDWGTCITAAQELYCSPTADDRLKFEACLTMGRAYMDAGQSEADAVAVLEVAVELKPDDAPALSCLAQCYDRIGNRQDAIAAARRCLALAPQDEACRRIST